MAELVNGANVPQEGMIEDISKNNRSSNQYSYALNATNSEFTGENFVLQNEHSNILEINFPTGFIVIGKKEIPEQERVIYFLVNPVTKISQIGETLKKSFFDLTDEFFQNCYSCTKQEFLERTPLEKLKQKPFSAYFKIIESDCLNFNENYPVDVEYKITQCGLNIYFTDNLNQRRFIYFDYIDNNSEGYLTLNNDFKKITAYTSDDCSVPIYSDELDCNKINYHPCYKKPKIDFIDFVSGGSAKAGTYQLLVAYADEEKQALTEYFEASNNVPLKTKDYTIETNYQTNLGLSFNISNLDGSVYRYFNVVIAETIDNFTEFKLIGNYPIRSINYNYNFTYLGNEEFIKLLAEEVFAKKPFYTKAKSVTSSNNYLFYGSPTELVIPNLQKIGNRIKLYWATSAVSEDIYKKAQGSFKFRSFMRDEVYSLSLILEFCNGSESFPIHIPGRQATPEDLQIISNNDVITQNACGNDVTLNKRWQLYNTGSIIGQPHEFTEDCENPKVWEWGEFSYHESSELYPNDSDLWGELCGKPIRFHKFPDSAITHIHNKKDIIIANHNSNFKEKNIIYPIGIKVDEDSVRNALLYALNEGLLTQEQYNSISGYRIVKGNRVGNKSIVAKGLLFDVWNYTKNNKTFYYPNYPYNDLRPDYFLAPTAATYDGSNTSSPTPSYFLNSKRYTFHSPDTSFVNPSLGTLLKLETLEYGSFDGKFDEAELQAKYKLLSKFSRIISLAYGVAAAQGEILKNILKNLIFLNLGGILNAVLVGGLSVLTEAEVLSNTIKNFTPLLNFALQYNSVGVYNCYKVVDNTGQKIRPIDKSSYLNPTVQSINEVLDFNTNQFSTINFNNWNRESSVYIKYSGTSFPLPSVQDRSRFTLSSARANNISQTFNNQISSYYASIKNYVPNQYGKISTIEYLETDSVSRSLDINFQNNPIILGGDIFINRFALKRKHPFFLQTRYNFANNSDVSYSELGNVAFPNYYFNSEDAIGERLTSNSEISIRGLRRFLNDGVLGLAKSRLDLKKNPIFYQKGYIHLYSYGIPYFITESDINVDYRHAENTFEKSFYPLQSDINTWLQEKNVPITEDNYYIYNKTYSRQNKENFIPNINEIYNEDEFCESQLFNRVIYSSARTLSSKVDPWIVFKANDYFDFSLSDGRLISVDGIENEKVLARLENVSRIFNAYDTLQTSENAVQVSTGGIFATRPKDFAKTTLGYAGSQNRDIIHTEFGHIWVDAKRGHVFNLGLNGQALDEISNKGLSNWFSQNLPFQLKKDFPELPIDYLDNSFNGPGITLGFDKRFKRLLITKKDYKLLDKRILFDSEKKQFYYLNNSEKIFVNLNNSSYFCDKSWTLSYSFLTKSWISYHSYKPNYYISNLKYFSSGLNSTNSSLWGHNLTNKSYQVFYGKLEPFVIDYITEKSSTSNFVNSVMFQLEVLRYHNEYDYFYKQDVSFNKAYVYNNSQNSGLLELIVKNEENLNSILEYPKYLLNKTEIEITNSENTWSFNDFLDVVKSVNNNIPIWLNTCANDYKNINPLALNYGKTDWEKGNIRSSQVNVRLINDKHSNYKMIYLFSVVNQTKSIR